MNRGGNGHVGASQPSYAVLNDNAFRLVELAEDLLDIKRIAFAFLEEKLEKLLGHLVGTEKSPHHAVDVVRPEALDPYGFCHWRDKPRCRKSRPRAQHQKQTPVG